MSWRKSMAGSMRGIGLGVLACALLATAPVRAQFLPPDFFAHVPIAGAPAAVEANTLTYDAQADVISADGQVQMRYEGYLVSCDSLRYDQRNGQLLCVGNAAVTDPGGNRYAAERIEITDELKAGFVRGLRLTTADGALITASDAQFDTGHNTVLNDASYAPCGECVDAKGDRIGWRVRAVRFVQDHETDTVTMEEPVLEILGMPVAWLPWISLPDPSKPRNSGFRLPSLDYDEQLGLKLDTPYFIGIGEDIDILLSPSLMSRQGLLLGASWEQRFDYGRFDVEGFGIYQLDPGAFAGEVGERDWRWSLRGSGEVTVAEGWQLGGRFTSFSDAAFLDDYHIDSAGRTVNEVYATHLAPDSYADARLQQFVLLGNVTEAQQDEQAYAVPNARTENYVDLGDFGQARLSTRLLGVVREADSTESYAGTDYVLGYEGSKAHGVIEGSWQNQTILPGGLVVTPYLGLRGDIAGYDGESSLIGAPGETLMYAATPIAAMDVRFPLLATNGSDTHLVEPIAQVVYRGSDTTLPGITNDDAHSLVLDDTNLFSYNRFSGFDRQETGLRANIGARYLANLSGGRWLEISGGQSFQLAGVNSFADPDEMLVGTGSGLEDAQSDIVLAARGSPATGVTLGSKVQIDPDGPEVARAGFEGRYALGEDLWVGGDYVYLAADPALGVTEDQHEVALKAGVPLPMDYWTATGGIAWDIASNQFLEANGEVLYDDDYFLAGAYATLTGPTHDHPDDLSFGVKFRLKGPGMDFGL